MVMCVVEPDRQPTVCLAVLLPDRSTGSCRPGVQNQELTRIELDFADVLCALGVEGWASGVDARAERQLGGGHLEHVHQNAAALFVTVAVGEGAETCGHA